MKLTGREAASGLGLAEGPVALASCDILVVEIGGARLTRVSLSGPKKTVIEFC